MLEFVQVSGLKSLFHTLEQLGVAKDLVVSFIFVSPSHFISVSVSDILKKIQNL